MSFLRPRLRAFIFLSIVGFTAAEFFLMSYGYSSPAVISESSPRALVHLLDYLGSDYAGAVSPDGRIISQSEYREQQEFSQTVYDMSKELPETKTNSNIVAATEKLKNLVAKKAPPKEVAATSQQAKELVIGVAHLQIAPTSWPNLSLGQQVYQQNCVTCHGEKADGHGPAAQALNPPPISFFDNARMNPLSPFNIFNAIRIGVPGTAMAPLSHLSDEDTWAVAFYVTSLRYKKFSENEKKSSVDEVFDQLSKEIQLSDVASMPDDQLQKVITEKNNAAQRSAQTQNLALAALRTHSGENDYKNTLNTAKFYLQASVSDYKNGNGSGAKHQALLGYLEGVEPVEPRLKASDPQLMIDLESKMADVREAIEKKVPLSELIIFVKKAENQIEVAQKVLTEAAPSASLTFLIAAAILLREGFEAVLMIIALLGVIRASGVSHASKWVHGGWVAALFLGFVTWFFSGWLMVFSGAQREAMEGVTSLFAVIVLLYMGFWLHRTTEIGRWKAFIDGKVKSALEGSNLFGLFVISFIAVFREAFETVLFLRALWLEGGMDTKSALVAGVFGALALVFILAWGILKYTAKIPIRKMFDFSAVLMTVLAVILIGKGLHSLQEMGWLTITASPLNVRIDLVGLYPTLETVFSQVIILVLAASLWYFGKRPSRPPKISAT